jgi:hypothetical protein
VDADLTAATWRKSTYSNGSGGNCIEATTTPSGHPALRDSKDPIGPALLITASHWRTFLHAIKASD